MPALRGRSRRGHGGARAPQTVPEASRRAFNRPFSKKSKMGRSIKGSKGRKDTDRVEVPNQVPRPAQIRAELQLSIEESVQRRIKAMED